jgi:hypothetical protein
MRLESHYVYARRDKGMCFSSRKAVKYHALVITYKLWDRIWSLSSLNVFGCSSGMRSSSVQDGARERRSALRVATHRSNEVLQVADVTHSKC